MSRSFLAAAACAALCLLAPAAHAQIEEPPLLAADVKSGKVPPMAKRLPRVPLLVEFDGKTRVPGRYGGELRMLMAKDRDIRMMVVYGYSRLVGYNERLELVPDVLERFENVDNRVFTFHLRPGHRWSDGEPFTAEDFRYYWEDVATNKTLNPLGLPQTLLVNGKGPRFEVLSPTRVRYTWDDPNPLFLPAIAGPSPLFVYRPAHYLRQFHARYIGEDKAKELAAKAKARNWAGLHHKKDEQYRFDNPELPTLEPWANTTPMPSTRFVFVRNPYFHRVDPAGRQLPYIDRVVINIADDKLIPPKTGSGDVDLQARYLRFDNYTFLKKNEKQNQYQVRLWKTAKGSHIALYPNLNAADPVWQPILRDVRFRRAISLAIDRHEINEVVYFGLVQEGANTVLPQSPLYRPEYRTAWARFDLKAANALLDEMGLKQRDKNGLRLLPDGRPMEIVVDTAGESTEETDVLELVRDSWQKVGIGLFPRPSQREVFRKRVFAGQSIMAVWSGLESAVPSADSSPAELVPTRQDQLQWPLWGNWYESNRKGGEKPALQEVRELADLYEGWRRTASPDDRRRMWTSILEINADQVYTIGIVTGTLQPVVVANALRNVPVEGLYNWDPGAYFGMYRPDTFWLDRRNGS
jgi:peptide/nickel transport system substrate-binding protein